MSQRPVRERLVVPPASLEVLGSDLCIGGLNLLGSSSPRLRRLVDMLEKCIDGHGPRVPLRINCDNQSSLFPPKDMDESYGLRITQDGINVMASEEWGAIRALSMLANLIEQDGRLPCLEAEDSPVYGWRGLLLDPARRFLSLGALERTLVGMWACRLNVLHLHLSDDQGLRIPLLSQVPQCQHYSHEELRRLVAFAADFGIRVLPEIDLPGHATGLLVSFPHWAKGASPTSFSKRFGVHENFIDCASGEIREELEAMIAELAEVFPDACLHLGGDECVGYEVPEDFWSFLVAAAGSRGKQVVFWDEVLGSKLPSEAVVQVWRHHELLDVARQHGNVGILSAPYYLDLMFPSELHHAFDPAGSLESRQAAQSRLIASPKLRSIKDALEWYEAHRGPLADSLKETPSSTASLGAILGGEACLWGELVGEAQLDTRLWSRLPAIASRLWLGEASVVPDRREAEAHLHAIAGIRVGPDAWLEDLELSQEERSHLVCLLDCLEPVKWYSRLLGEALGQRLEGLEAESLRTYGADSRLDRVVDFVHPESWQAALFANAADKRKFVTAWHSQGAVVEQVAQRVRPIREILPLSRRLADLAKVIQGTLSLEEFERRHPDADEPVAELILAVLPLAIDWKLSERRNSGS